MPIQRSSFSPEDSEQDRDARIELQAFANRIWKRRWVLLSVLIVGLALTIFSTVRQQKIYSARASIIIDPKAPEILGAQVQEVVQLGAGQMWWNQEYYNTQINILESRALAESTVRRNSLHRNKTFSNSIADMESDEQAIEKATSLLRNILSIAPESEQNRIHYIKAKHPAPKMAAFVANAHVDTYINYVLNLRLTGTSSATEWLSEELDAAEKAVSQTETALFNFKKENDILSGSIEDRQSLVSSEIQRNTDALIDARLKRLELEAKRARVRTASKLPVLESPIFALVENETGLTLKDSYYQAKQNLAEMSLELGPRNPELIREKKRVETLLSAVQREARTSLRSIEEQYRIAASTEKLYEEELGKHRSVAFTLAEKAKDFNDLSRKEKDATKTLDVMLGRLRSSELTSRLKTVNIRRLDPALVPKSPSSPKMGINLAMGLFVSLMAGLGLVFLLDFLDRTVKSGQHVEEASGAPLLGIIPIVEETQDMRDMHIIREPTSRAAECCRSIRTNLLFMAADEDFNTLLVASPNPREGKSTTAMYLATTMAQSGKRVLVIDSDMRRPRLHQAFGISRTAGLSNYILGDVTREEAVFDTDIPNLSVLSAGPTPPNPVELLMTDRFDQAMAELREHYDRVILDSPPVLAVTDALVLSRKVDGVVFVVRANSTTRDDVRRASKQLRDVNARIAGAILNHLDLSHQTGGYYYGYGYGTQDSDDKVSKIAS